jgi:3'-phosphoadenosine 5'-phosphosulfate sulfotransferase (PAPS reductase)/FAD synthetase
MESGMGEKTPRHVLGLSGGKDSTCLALAMKERHPELDMEYICTPTGNELPELFCHLDRLEVMLGKPIARLGIGKTLHQLIDEMGMLPNFRARWCTRMLKIEPSIEFMLALPAGSLLYVGLRADEPDRTGIYGDDVRSVFPFKEWGWTEADVWRFLDNRGIVIPTRTDCGDCYHQRIVEWRNYWRDHPDLYAESVSIERRHGHTFRSPGRDTWPVSLAELAKDFERRRPIRGDGKINDRGSCRVCSL